MVKITIKKGFVGNRKYTGGRPDFYIVTNRKGNKFRVSTKERAMEIASASRRLIRKRKKIINRNEFNIRIPIPRNFGI